MKFVKMNGCGNDYIYFDCIKGLDDSEAARVLESVEKLSDRHFGVGGDGVVLICPSENADAKMRMFNSDGSEGRMCGNAIRCVGKYLYDNRYVEKDEITIETLSGIKRLNLEIDGGVCVGATVNMGRPVLNAAEIPMDMTELPKGYGDVAVETAVGGGLRAKTVVSMPYVVGETEYRLTAVSMGNPHCVVFVDEPVETLPLDKLGPVFETLPLFPERVNTEFVNVLGGGSFRMRVWERGSGETLACGTGSCAVGVAAILNDYAKPRTPLTILLTGGTLTVEDTPDGVLMTGPAETNFQGEIEL